MDCFSIYNFYTNKITMEKCEICGLALSETQNNKHNHEEDLDPLDRGEDCVSGSPETFDEDEINL
jgi:hypothetical protein